MKTIWAFAGALCLAVGSVQAAPTADVVQDVGNGVNQISEKSAEVSSEVEVDVATPFLVARVSTILTAATPAIYQDASKNPSELSERIVKPLTLLLNSVSGGVTTLAKDNSRRFFVPSFVRFNFRQDALVELDRIRRTERFWNETEQYVNSVCGRLKKYIEIQRRRGSQVTPKPTPTVTTSTAAPPSASLSETTESPARSSLTAVHVGVRGDLKLSISEHSQPIEVPTTDLPDKKNPVRPVHPVFKPRPTLQPQAAIPIAPLKEPTPEVLAPKPVSAVESVESASVAPSEVHVESTPIPSTVAPVSPVSTETVPEADLTTESAATTEAVANVAIEEQATLAPRVLAPVEPQILEEPSPSLENAASVPAERTIVVPPVISETVEEPKSEVAVPVVAPRTESAPEPTPIVEEKVPEIHPEESAVAASTRSEIPADSLVQEESSPIASVRVEPSQAVLPEEQIVPEVVPAVEVKPVELAETKSVPAPEIPSAVDPAVLVPVEEKAVEQVPAEVTTTQATLAVETTPVVVPVTELVKTDSETVPQSTVSAASIAALPASTESAPAAAPVEVASSPVDVPQTVISPEAAESVAVPVIATVSSAAPEAVTVAPTTAVPEIVEASSVATVAPVAQVSTTTAVPPIVEPVTTTVLPKLSFAESTTAPVAVQAPIFPEVITPTKTAVETEPVVIPSTESTVSAGSSAEEPAKRVEESTTAAPDVTSVQPTLAPTAKPAAQEVHRVHPVSSTIVFPTRASSKITQSVNVSQFSSQSSSEDPGTTIVSSTTVTSSRSDSSKSTIEALRFEQVALSHPIVIRPVKSPLPIAIPHRVIKHSSDGLSVVRTQSTRQIDERVENVSQ